MVGVCLKYQQRNYGSKLQALATVKKLEQLGVDYEILRYNKKTPGFVLAYLLRCCNIVFLHDRYDQLQRAICFRLHRDIREKVALRNRRFSEFDDRYFTKLSEPYRSYGDLKSCSTRRYDRFLTCSDQLWSPSALASGFYNLMFAPEAAEKISWASSFGVSAIPWYQRRRTVRYLQRIQKISMRENRGAQIVQELTGRTVPVLMDPVFVFSREDWEVLIPAEKPQWEEYIFCYFLGTDPSHRAAANRLAEKTGKKIVTLRHLDRYVARDAQFGDYAPYDLDVNGFLNLIRYADYVCTDSFHGCAFSIIMEKKFVVFDRYDSRSPNSKNSRIDSLCTNLRLQSRRFSEDRDILDIADAPVDLLAVRSFLQTYAEETERYLKDAFLAEDAVPEGRKLP